MRRLTTPLPLFLLLILAIAVIVNFGPSERTLGTNVRLVYLHGAWVWTALISYGFAALFGILGLAMTRINFHTWSVSFGRVATFFWITYLPISLWTMQANWNGIFLAEPRWRLAFDFAVTGIFLQLAIPLLKRPDWASVINILFLVTLLFSLTQTEQIMHPPSPIMSSNSITIQAFFLGLLIMCLLSAWQLARWLKFRLKPA
jgi:hypothetical protein